MGFKQNWNPTLNILESQTCEWTFIWAFKSPAIEIAIEQHTVQLKDFSFVWTLICIFSLPDDLNTLPQSEHTKGVSPVWTAAICRFKSAAAVNDKPQYGQRWGFSLLWSCICNLRVPCCENDLPHSSQGKGFSPVWIRICLSRFCFLENDLVQ